jgi:hypothetical protein
MIVASIFAHYTIRWRVYGVLGVPVWFQIEIEPTLGATLAMLRRPPHG